MSSDMMTPSGRTLPTLTLRALRWLTVLGPLLFLGAVALVRRTLLQGLQPIFLAEVVALTITTVAVIFFSRAVLDRFEQMQASILRHNELLTQLSREAEERAAQLKAANEAGLALVADLTLEVVVQRIVDLARELAEARYGALSVLHRETGAVAQFFTSGITEQERARMGALPEGRGILALVVNEGRPVRLPDLTSHSAAVGFPPNHPSMHSFLGVPILYKGRVLGSLYLTEKRGATEFSLGDEAVVTLFAAHAAVALENARLHAEVQQLAVEEERQRIAREMHDGLAQVLAYVSMKTGAVRHLVDLGRSEEAVLELERLEAAAREVYADVREGILGLRTVTQGGPGFLPNLRQYVERFSQQTGLPVALTLDCPEEELDVGPAAEVQLIRVIQEALSNVRKHAEAHAAQVRFTRADGALILTVVDDGRGFEPAAQNRGEGPRFGLQTMRERVESLGGSFAIDATPGRGTTVRVSVPLPRARR